MAERFLFQELNLKFRESHPQLPPSLTLSKVHACMPCRSLLLLKVKLSHVNASSDSQPQEGGSFGLSGYRH